MHLKVFRLGGTCFIEDLKSTNGTFVNGKRIAPGEGLQVEAGDAVSIGDTEIHFQEIPTKGPFDLKELRPPPDVRPGHGDHRKTADRRKKTGKELKVVEAVSELFKKQTDPRGFLNEILELLTAALPRIDRAAIFLFDSPGLAIKDVLLRTRGERPTQFLSYNRQALKGVLKEGKAVMVQDTAFEGQPGFLETEQESGEIKCFMCVPVTANSKLHAAIYVDGVNQSYAFRKDDLSLVNCLATPLGIAIQNTELAFRLSSIANLLSET
jgi:transcriptional regulator with GAF, ATPase, and Fis domain